MPKKVRAGQLFVSFGVPTADDDFAIVEAGDGMYVPAVDQLVTYGGVAYRVARVTTELVDVKVGNKDGIAQRVFVMLEVLS